MMNPFSISTLIFDTIPQLYEAEEGPHQIDLAIAGESSRVFSITPLSPPLTNYLTHAASIWDELRPMTEGKITQIIEREWIQQQFVVAWLESRTRISTWSAILDYFRRLSRRHSENKLLGKTVIIEPASLGKADDGAPRLTDPNYFKVFDWLGSSVLTHFRVDEDLGIKSLDSISLTPLEEGSGRRFYPDFLHPAIASLDDSGSVVAHLSDNGSLLIADRHGLLASKRDLESWVVYDVDHIVDAVTRILKHQRGEATADERNVTVANGIFQVLFGISMKRQGGLIVLDRPKNMEQYILKGIERGKDQALERVFTRMPIQGLATSVTEARKLVELSSVDGALMLDHCGNLLQIGSMVMPHPSTYNQFGTRDSAAYSAAKYGATSFKVSANGNITIFFTTPALTGGEVHRFEFR